MKIDQEGSGLELLDSQYGWEVSDKIWVANVCLVVWPAGSRTKPNFEETSEVVSASAGYQIHCSFHPLCGAWLAIKDR